MCWMWPNWLVPCDFGPSCLGPVRYSLYISISEYIYQLTMASVDLGLYLSVNIYQSTILSWLQTKYLSLISVQTAQLAKKSKMNSDKVIYEPLRELLNIL